jgi:hypothetical protein
MANLLPLDTVLCGHQKLCLLAPSGVWRQQEAAQSLVCIVKVSWWENWRAKSVIIRSSFLVLSPDTWTIAVAKTLYGMQKVHHGHYIWSAVSVIP